MKKLTIDKARNIWLVIVTGLLMAACLSVAFLAGRVKILQDVVYALTDKREREKVTDQDHYKVFSDNMTVGRTVYQWAWYQPFATRVGPLYLRKHYAMTPAEYDELMELCWKLNRYLCLPKDDWKNYIPPADFIVESALKPDVEHKTGEVIALTGFMPTTMWEAYKIYKYVVKPIRGSDMYIYGLDKADPNFEEIFKDPKNAVKLYYVYFRWLLERYEYNWAFALTAYHFGPGKTEYWWSLGYRNIPRYGYRGQGKWEKHFMKNYYLTVFEIAQSLATGELVRASRLKKTVAVYRKVNQSRANFVDYMRIKVQQKDESDELKREIERINEKHTRFEQTTEKVLQVAGEGMGLMLDYEYFKKQEALEPFRAIKRKMKEMWCDYQDKKEKKG